MTPYRRERACNLKLRPNLSFNPRRHSSTHCLAGPTNSRWWNYDARGRRPPKHIGLPSDFGPLFTADFSTFGLELQHSNRGNTPADIRQLGGKRKQWRERRGSNP